MIPPLVRMKYDARQNSIRGGLIFTTSVYLTQLEQWRNQQLPKGKLPTITMEYNPTRTTRKGSLDVVVREVNPRPLFEGIYSHEIVVSDGRNGIATFGVLTRSGRLNLHKANRPFQMSLKKGLG